VKFVALSGLTAAKKCNMRFGEVLEPFSGGYYIYSFYGLLDSVSEDMVYLSCNTTAEYIIDLY
jgi:hypothetical protein